LFYRLPVLVVLSLGAVGVAASWYYFRSRP